MKFTRAIFWLIIAFIVALLAPEAVWATTVTGSIKQGGQPLTGYVDVALVYPATNGTALNLPGAGAAHQPIYNGNFPAMTLDGNDTLLPRGTYYQVTYYDAYQTPLSRMNYVITGATFDIGTAVPTPVTTSNINFLDLLGLRNVSIQNLTVTNALTFGTATIGPLGLTGAKQVNDTRWTVGYLAGSSTCGIQEAINSLPSTGGTVYMANGTCTITTAVNVNKSIHLIGMGQGSTNVLNGQASGDMLRITSNDVSLSDFTLLGNNAVGGASSGANITAFGTVDTLTISKVTSNGAFSNGLNLQGTVTQVMVLDSTFSGNRADNIGMSTAGSITGLIFANVVMNGSIAGSGFSAAGSGIGNVSIFDSVAASNIAGDGILIQPGANSSSFHIYHNQIIDNGNAGISINDGFGHVVEDNRIAPGAHQQVGVAVNTPTLSDAFTNQVTVRDNNVTGHVSGDIATSATMSYMLFYPQVEQIGGLSTYVFADPTKVHIIGPAVANPTLNCSGTSCWKNNVDGSIEMWGTAAGCTTAPTCTTSVAFPSSFTTSTALAVNANCLGAAANCTMGVSSITTSGFTVLAAAAVEIGGGGSNTSPGIVWHAIGH